MIANHATPMLPNGIDTKEFSIGANVALDCLPETMPEGCYNFRGLGTILLCPVTPAPGCNIDMCSTA